MWDTGGQQRYRPVLASCYRGATGVIIVFDVTNMVSFRNVKQYILEVEEFAPNSNIPRMLVSFFLKLNLNNLRDGLNCDE